MIGDPQLNIVSICTVIKIEFLFQLFQLHDIFSGHSTRLLISQ
jgi:hypothetical protein